MGGEKKSGENEGRGTVRKSLANILKVTSGNVMSLLAGILVGFIIPKILSMSDYGYYKQFNLYTTYIGLFSIGIADGVVLRYGDHNLNMLNKEKFRSYFYYFLLIQTFFMTLIIVQSFFYTNGEYRFIMCSFGLNIIAMNVTGYFQQISQITQRFNEYTFRNMMQSALSVISVIIMFLLYKINNDTNYHIYIVILLFCNYLLAGWYIVTYRELVFGRRTARKENIKDVGYLIRNGFPLMCANLCSIFILVLDRQFVAILFTAETFAVYAFAYNLLSLVTVATSATSIVLYPMLKRTTEPILKRNYGNLVMAVLAFSFFAIGVYYPLCAFIKWYLPKYIESLQILRIVFPGLASIASITVVIQNYYKILNKHFLLFRKNMVILFLSIVANITAYKIMPTPSAISVASILILSCWFIYVNHYIKKKYYCGVLKNIIYMVLMTAVFYLVSMINYVWLGFIVYETIFIILSFLLYHKQIFSLVKSMKTAASQ